MLPTPARGIDLPTLRAKLAAQQRQLGDVSGAYVRDLATGRALYTLRATTTRVPASNEKLLTTSAALLRFGPGARLSTVLEALGPPADGIIDGDVALVGVGDPYLTTSQLRRIAGKLAALGVTEITGKVLGDGTHLDRRRGSFDSDFAYDTDLGGSLGGLVLDGGHGRDPALYAATRLREALLAADIVVRKGAHTGTLGPDAVPIAGALSAPLRTAIARINVPSDNFAAELLLKDIGASFGAGGSTAAGAAVVRSTLAGLGVSAQVYDGSGLSRSDRVSPREVVDLLTGMASLPEEGIALRASLPVAGRTGTLSHRMRRTAAQDACSAKTGTLRGVSALSGYCQSAGGDLLAFSFIENSTCETCAKRIEDRMVPLIARYG